MIDIRKVNEAAQKAIHDTVREYEISKLKHKVWYLCDGEKEDCEKQTCYKHSNESGHSCKWTSDIRHAVNFKKERERPIECFREKDIQKGAEMKEVRAKIILEGADAYKKDLQEIKEVSESTKESIDRLAHRLKSLKDLKENSLNGWEGQDSFRANRLVKAGSKIVARDRELEALRKGKG